MSARHQWSPARRTSHRTERVCLKCGLVKVTRHEPDALPWQEFERRGRILRGVQGTPKCEVGK